MLFHCESANDLFSWRRITELFSPCLCASKKKKNKRQIQWFGLTITNISLSIFFSLLLHRFGGITLLRLYFYKQNIYLGRLRTAKNLTTQGCKIVKAPGFWDQTAFNSLARLIEELIKMSTGLKFCENIQIMTQFLNLDQLCQIRSSTFHLRCWFQWYYYLLAISSRISKPQPGLWVGLSSQNFHRFFF